MVGVEAQTYPPKKKKLASNFSHSDDFSKETNEILRKKKAFHHNYASICYL